jgi:hypothetical protein
MHGRHLARIGRCRTADAEAGSRAMWAIRQCVSRSRDAGALSSNDQETLKMWGQSNRWSNAWYESGLRKPLHMRGKQDFVTAKSMLCLPLKEFQRSDDLLDIDNCGSSSMQVRWCHTNYLRALPVASLLLLCRLRYNITGAHYLASTSNVGPMYFNTFSFGSSGEDTPASKKSLTISIDQRHASTGPDRLLKHDSLHADQGVRPSHVLHIENRTHLHAGLSCRDLRRKTCSAGIKHCTARVFRGDVCQLFPNTVQSTTPSAKLNRDESLSYVPV